MSYPTDKDFEDARTNRAPPKSVPEVGASWNGGLNDYQQAALRTARVDPEAPLLRIDIARDALGLTGEAGEVADHVKKYVGHGHPLDTEKVHKELGDVLWYVAVLARRIGSTLEDVAASNVEKLRRRYPEGFTAERSINRKDD